VLFARDGQHSRPLPRLEDFQAIFMVERCADTMEKNHRSPEEFEQDTQ